jgi:uncharacterized protein
MPDLLRIVIDTNVLVRAVSGKSFTSFVFDALFEQKFTLHVTSDIVLEYEEILTRVYDEEIAELVISALRMLPNVIHTNVYFDLRLIAADADDDKFVNCAFAANAHYLVSDDRHYKVLKEIPFPKIHCIGYEGFKEILISK